MLSGLAYAALQAAGLPALSRRLHRGGLVLCYHNVWRGRHTPGPGDPGLQLPLDRFEAQMWWLRRHYTVIPLVEMAGRLRDGRSLQGTVALTFDDGYDGVLAWGVPVLRALHLPATLFIVASAPDAPRPFWWDHPLVRGAHTPARHQAWLEEQRGDGAAILGSFAPLPAFATAGLPRSATWSAIAGALSPEIEVGAHSLGHRTLPRLTDAELAIELEQGRAIIEQRLGVRPTLFAYPYGRWDRRVRDAVRAAGYTAAVTLDPGPVTRGDDPWSLRRLNIPAGLDAPAYACWLAGLRRAVVT